MQSRSHAPFTGEAVGITDNLSVDRYNTANFDVSQTGILVHRTATNQAELQFVWFDRTGKPLGNAGEPGMYGNAFDLSMDGRKIADFQNARENVKKATAEANAAHGGRVVTELAPLASYWRAEDDHQHYFANHPGQGYCAFVVAPKVEKFRRTFKARVKG